MNSNPGEGPPSSSVVESGGGVSDRVVSGGVVVFTIVGVVPGRVIVSNPKLNRKSPSPINGITSTK